jgi:hypothetical protein
MSILTYIVTEGIKYEKIYVYISDVYLIIKIDEI